MKYVWRSTGGLRSNIQWAQKNRTIPTDTNASANKYDMNNEYEYANKERGSSL